jgi:hypothetical protein
MISIASYTPRNCCSRINETAIARLSNQIKFLREIEPVATREVAIAYGYAVTFYMTRDLDPNFEIPSELMQLSDAYFRRRLVDFISGTMHSIFDHIYSARITELPKHVISALKQVNDDGYVTDLVANASAVRATIVPDYFTSFTDTLRPNEIMELRWNHANSYDGDGGEWNREAVDSHIKVKLHAVTDMMSHANRRIRHILLKKEASECADRYCYNTTGKGMESNEIKSLIGAFCDVAEAVLYILAVNFSCYGVRNMNLPNILLAGHMLDSKQLSKQGALICKKRSYYDDDRTTIVATMPPEVVLCISGAILSTEPYMLEWLQSRVTRNKPHVSNIVYNFICEDVAVQTRMLSDSKHVQEQLNKRRGECNG